MQGHAEGGAPSDRLQDRIEGLSGRLRPASWIHNDRPFGLRRLFAVASCFDPHHGFTTIVPDERNLDTTEFEKLLEPFAGLALDSFEAVPLLNKLVPEFYVYLVRLCDGRECYPRARVTFALDALAPDAAQVSAISDLLRRVIHIDLFNPPQRERIREAAVSLDDGNRTHLQIAALIPEQPTTTAVYRALKLQKVMQSLGLTSPYVLVENPTEIDSLSRYKNARYVFTPAPGYQQPPLA